jgi:hypothetical protein
MGRGAAGPDVQAVHRTWCAGMGAADLARDGPRARADEALVQVPVVVGTCAVTAAGRGAEPQQRAGLSAGRRGGPCGGALARPHPRTRAAERSAGRLDSAAARGARGAAMLRARVSKVPESETQSGRSCRAAAVGPQLSGPSGARQRCPTAQQTIGPLPA